MLEKQLTVYTKVVLNVKAPVVASAQLPVLLRANNHYRSADLLSKQEYYQQVTAKLNQDQNNQQQMMQLSKERNVLLMGSFIANIITGTVKNLSHFG